MVIMFMVEDRFIGSATCWVVCKAKRCNRVSVEREVSSDEIGPLWLLRLEEVLRSKTENEQYTWCNGKVSDLAGSLDHSFHSLAT